MKNKLNSFNLVPVSTDNSWPFTRSSITLLSMLLGFLLGAASSCNNESTIASAPVKPTVQQTGQNDGKPVEQKEIDLPARQCMADAQQRATYEDIGAQLRTTMKSRIVAETLLTTHEKILDHHQRNLDNLATLYPANTFSIALPDIFRSFDGSGKSSWLEVHLLPFLPLSLVVLSEAKATFAKLNANCGKTSYSGLKVSAPIHPDYEIMPDRYAEDLAYISDVNARAMGFRYAQIIPELSSNIAAADQYYYNGMHPWSDHTSVAKDDQLTRPVRLNNFFHIAERNLYVISPTPNFAIKIQDQTRSSALLTAFLWKAEAVTTDTPPDFIFQIELALRFE